MTNQIKAENISCCVLCESNQLTEIYSDEMKDRHTDIPGVFRVVRCQTCSLVFLNPIPTDDELINFYDSQSYYSYQDYFQKPKETKLKSIFALPYRTIVNIKTFDPQMPPGKMLDIGCGSGEFIHQYKQTRQFNFVIMSS